MLKNKTKPANLISLKVRRLLTWTAETGWEVLISKALKTYVFVSWSLWRSKLTLLRLFLSFGVPRQLRFTPFLGPTLLLDRKDYVPCDAEHCVARQHGELTPQVRETSVNPLTCRSWLIRRGLRLPLRSSHPGLRAAQHTDAEEFTSGPSSSGKSEYSCWQACFFYPITYSL